MTKTDMASALLRSGRIDRETYQYRIESVDSLRRAVHDTAISSCAQINRLCDLYHIPHICLDSQDRTIIGNFCAVVTNELFLSGTHRVPEVSRAVTASLKCTDKTALDRVVEMLQNGDIGLQPKKRASEELLR